MSLVTLHRPAAEPARHRRRATPPMRLEAQQPILTAEDMEKIRHIELFTGGAFRSLRARHLLSGGVGRATAWRRRSRRLCRARPRTRSARATTS